MPGFLQAADPENSVWSSCPRPALQLVQTYASPDPRKDSRDQFGKKMATSLPKFYYEDTFTTARPHLARIRSAPAQSTRMLVRGRLVMDNSSPRCFANPHNNRALRIPPCQYSPGWEDTLVCGTAGSGQDREAVRNRENSDYTDQCNKPAHCNRKQRPQTVRYFGERRPWIKVHTCIRPLSV